MKVIFERVTHCCQNGIQKVKALDLGAESPYKKLSRVHINIKCLHRSIYHAEFSKYQRFIRIRCQVINKVESVHSAIHFFVKISKFGFPYF